MPTDDEINRALAEKVMGWTTGTVTQWGMKKDSFFDEDGEFELSEDWNPLKNIEQALMCAEELPPEKRIGFIAHLIESVSKQSPTYDLDLWDMVNATAEQRARACYEAAKEGGCGTE